MRQRTETKMNKLQELFVRRVELMGNLRHTEAEIAEILGEVADINMEAPREEKTKKYQAKAKGTRKARSCSLCGEQGHQSNTCTENKPENFGFEKGEKKTPKAMRPGDEIEITEQVRESVNALCREGGALDAVMERYDIPRAAAIRLIARVKNVNVPEDSE